MDGLDKDNTYVLLIGASKYPNWGVMDIPNVQVNLKEIESILLDPFYCGIPKGKIKVIEDENLEDTNNGIQEFFDDIQTPKATVILYYSGHGLQSARAMDELFLATRNIREKTFEASSIKISELRRLFSECIATRKILLLDCCYAGKITKGFMSDDSSESIAKLNDFEGTYIMAASSEYERAKFDPDDPNSPTKFTGQFLEVIKNGIESDEEYCTLNSIYTQIRSSFLIQKDAPKPVQIGQNNIGNLPIFKNKKFLEKVPKDEQEWNKVIVLNTIYAYNSFIDQFPESKYKDEAEKRIQYLEDELAWKKTCNKNTIWGYRDYLNNYKNHIEEAKNRLKDLSLIEQEKEIWQLAVSENKIGGFNKYCDTYPNGIHVDEANQYIKELTEKDRVLNLKKDEEKINEEQKQKQEHFKEEQFWKQLSTDNTINSYLRYINDYPNGKYKDEAEKKIDNLRILNEEEIYWKKVDKKSIFSLKIYLENYPKGKYCDEANYKINVLVEKENEKLRSETKQEKISNGKIFKKKYILYGFGIFLIIFLIWFFSKSNENPQPITTSTYKDSTIKVNRDSIFGRELTKDLTRLFYTNQITLSDAERVVNFMSLHGFDNSDSITQQLDRDNDTILFKYILYNINEATLLKSSMLKFGKLLSDSLFSDKPFKVMVYNINDNLEYFSYTFGINNTRKETTSVSTSAAPKSKLSGKKDTFAIPRKLPENSKLSEHDKLYTGKYLEPKFPGGDEALISYLDHCGLNYQFVKENDIPAGKYSVFFTFQVDETGHPGYFTPSYIYGYGYILYKKITECLKNGPLWQPGKAGERFVKRWKDINFDIQVENGFININVTSGYSNFDE